MFGPKFSKRGINGVNQTPSPFKIRGKNHKDVQPRLLYAFPRSLSNSLKEAIFIFRFIKMKTIGKLYIDKLNNKKNRGLRPPIQN